MELVVLSPKGRVSCCLLLLARLCVAVSFHVQLVLCALQLLLQTLHLSQRGSGGKRSFTLCEKYYYYYSVWLGQRAQNYRFYFISLSMGANRIHSNAADSTNQRGI